MRVPPVASGASACAVALLASTLLLGHPRAEEVKPAPPGPCTTPEATLPPPRPKFAELTPFLDENDEIAALEAIRVALSEVGDGASYVWHRQHGRLSGVVQPTSSFKDQAGRICRHIRLVLTTGHQTGRIEGIACRLANGRWQLDG